MFKKGKDNPAKRPEIREKLSRIAIERIKRDGHPKRTLGKHWKIKDTSRMNKDKRGKHTWNYGLTKEIDERVNNISKKNMGRKPTKISIEKGISTRKKNGSLRRHSKFMKSRWAQKEYKENQIKKWIKGCKLKPNKKEIFLDKIIQNNFPSQFILNVAGEMIINGKIPDWIDCKQKRIILFNGIYWHLLRLQEKNPSLTKELVENIEKEPYMKFGFNVLHIWEDELKNPNKLRQKLKDFVKI